MPHFLPRINCNTIFAVETRWETGCLINWAFLSRNYWDPTKSTVYVFEANKVGHLVTVRNYISPWLPAGGDQDKSKYEKKKRIFCGFISDSAAKSLQSCPIDGSPPGSPVPGIFQARTPEWVAISFSDAWKWKWSHLVISDSLRPMDCSLPGSSVHEISQARVLEWGAIAFSCYILPNRK